MNGASTILALPVVTANFGSPGWEAVALGFALGAAGSIIVELGWGVVGPLRIARASHAARATALWWSLQARLLVLGPVLVAAATLAAIIAHDYRPEAAAMAAAGTLVGLSPTWYFTGTGQPIRILVADSLPRLVATALGALALSMGAPLVVYPALLLVTGSASPWIGWLLGRTRSVRPRSLTFGRTVRLVRLQFAVLGSRVALALYTSVPLVIVAALAPSALPVYSAADRLLRSGLQLLNSVNLQLTGWVGRAVAREHRESRAKSALGATAFVAVVAGVASFALVPPVSQWLFSGTATVGLLESALTGAIATVTILANGFARVLIIRLRTDIVVKAAWLRLGFGCVGVALGAVAYGAAGALCGLLFGELVALVYQALSVRMSRTAHAGGRGPA